MKEETDYLICSLSDSRSVAELGVESSSLEPRSILLLIKCDACGVTLKLVRRTSVGNGRIVIVPQEYPSSTQHFLATVSVCSSPLYTGSCATFTVFAYN